MDVTGDGHFVVVDGRRWRATDPDIGDDVAAELRRSLMSARRAVGAALEAHDSDAERAARGRVHAAKTALEERGTPWWEQSAGERRAVTTGLIRRCASRWRSSGRGQWFWTTSRGPASGVGVKSIDASPHERAGVVHGLREHDRVDNSRDGPACRAVARRPDPSRGASWGWPAR